MAENSWLIFSKGGLPVSPIMIDFTFHSGLKRQLFSNVRLSGSWNSSGRFSHQGTQTPMTAARDEIGCDVGE